MERSQQNNLRGGTSNAKKEMMTSCREAPMELEDEQIREQVREELQRRRHDTRRRLVRRVGDRFG
ncbi:hypothetical protein NHQ30_005996 [Ciborinia camelliae]|nr:hypothetical protein NHQ30_005996 [Ciborinia camelliae]